MNFREKVFSDDKYLKAIETLSEDDKRKIQIPVGQMADLMLSFVKAVALIASGSEGIAKAISSSETPGRF